MEIKTIAVLGAGAIGSYFISGLCGKFGENLWTIAEGARKERLERDGVTVNGRHIDLNVRTPDEAHGADLLIICVKYGALRAALDDVARVVDGHTLVLSTLNGVTSESVVAERIGGANIVHSFMKMSVRREGNTVTMNSAMGRGVLFGEVDGSRSERIKALDRAFGGSELRYSVRDDILRDMWFKYAINISRNLPQAILGCGAGAYVDSEHVKHISWEMKKEVIAVAAAKGIDISDQTYPISLGDTVKPTSRFSTLQDLDAKRPTEIEMFSGALVRMGRELGVPTPYNDFAYHAIKALEEKNAGKFDY